ncbi:hypothetical protein BKA93DRAFT_747093 [Sparassis latifolia]
MSVFFDVQIIFLFTGTPYLGSIWASQSSVQALRFLDGSDFSTTDCDILAGQRSRQELGLPNNDMDHYVATSSRARHAIEEDEQHSEASNNISCGAASTRNPTRRTPALVQRLNLRNFVLVVRLFTIGALREIVGDDAWITAKTVQSTLRKCGRTASLRYLALGGHEPRRTEDVQWIYRGPIGADPSSRSFKNKRLRQPRFLRIF